MIVTNQNTKEIPVRKKCAIPTSNFIGRGDDTERLYAAEDKLAKAIQRTAKELAKVREHAESEYWTTSMAETLMNALENSQREPAIAASIGFLRLNGIEVGTGQKVALPRGCSRQVFVGANSVEVEFST